MDVKDRVFLVTGGTSGVGKAIALGLARVGAKVVIVSRSAKRGEAASEEIAHATGNNQGEFLVADLSLQSSIRSVNEEFKSKFDHLHVLVNAAGAIFSQQQKTEEELDRSFAVNYLGHFLLTNLLLDALKESRPARILTVAGNPSFLKNPKINLQDIQLAKNYSGLGATSQAMVARTIFSFELAKRLEGTEVTSVAFHPGLIKSNLTQSSPFLLKVMGTVMNTWAKDECKVAVFLATAKEVENVSGVFFNDKMQKVPFHYDEEVGSKLWNLSEELTGNAAL